MSSNIDITKPESVNATTASVRANFEAAKTEIEALQTDKVDLNGALGTPTSGNLSNCTGTATLNINGTVGTTTPTDAYFSSVSVKTGSQTIASPALRQTHWGYSSTYRIVQIGATSGPETIALGYDPINNPSGAFTGYGGEILFRRGANFVTPNATDTAFNLSNLVLLDGKVGIGTNAPTEPLEVIGNIKPTGNVIIGTAGKGIDFSADGNVAGMTSELLDDYEEGTWTPRDSAGTDLAAYVFAYYRKVGSLVTITLDVTWTTHTAGRLTNLPFVNLGTHAGSRVCWTNGSVKTVLIGANATYADLYDGFLSIVNPASSRFIGSFVYQTV